MQYMFSIILIYKESKNEVILDDKVRIWVSSAKFVKAISGVYVLYDRKKEIIYNAPYYITWYLH